MQRQGTSGARVVWLAEEHQSLKRQVAALDKRAILTPTEQLQVVELKKRKLAMKDALSELQRD